MVLEQLAAAEASLTEDDKEFGAALVDIGAETTGLVHLPARRSAAHGSVSARRFALYERHRVWSAHADSRSGKDQAHRRLCLQHVAERWMRGELVDVPSVGGRAPRQLSRQILCDILQPRAEEVLMHVADEIKDSGWERQLSSGVVLTGGGALLTA